MANLKHLSRDAHIRGIVQKHMAALSREIAKELTQPLLDHWGLVHEALGSELDVPEASAIDVAVMPKTLLFDRHTRQWVCPRCGRYSDLRRRSVTAHLRSCDAPMPVAGKRIDLRALNERLRAKHRKPQTRRTRQAQKKS
jgi:hypothetical protein